MTDWKGHGIMKPGEIRGKPDWLHDLLLALGTVVGLALNTLHGLAQGTVFTHQGRLNDNGAPATGTYELPVTDNGTDKFVIVNPPVDSRFYRLFRP